MADKRDYKVGIPTLETNIADHGTGFAMEWKVPYTVTDGPARGTRGHVSVATEDYDAGTVHRAISTAVMAHQEVMRA